MHIPRIDWMDDEAELRAHRMLLADHLHARSAPSPITSAPI